MGGGGLGGGSSSLDSVVVERGAERAVHAWLLCRSLNFTVTLTLWEATPSHTSSCWLRAHCPTLASTSQNVQEPFAEGGARLVRDDHAERRAADNREHPDTGVFVMQLW